MPGAQQAVAKNTEGAPESTSPRVRASLWLVCALLVVIVAAWVFVGRSRSPVAAEGNAAPKPAHVEVAEIRAVPFRAERRFTGEVWAVSDAALTTGEAGRVERVHVVEGARVKAGQLLLELDDQLARAELSEAIAGRGRVEVEHDQALREAERFDKLARERVVSELETEREKSEATALGAERTRAKAVVGTRAERVQRYRILAPFDGVVTRRLVDPGDWLDSGRSALELVTDARVEVLVRVPADVLDRLATVSAVELVDGDRKVEASISTSVQALDRDTRTALVRLEPRARPEWLRAGSSVQAVFRLERSDGVTVPRDALVYGIANVAVVRVKDGRAEHVPVEVLDNSDVLSLVRADGLRPGDRLVVRGNERLTKCARTCSSAPGSRPSYCCCFCAAWRRARSSRSRSRFACSEPRSA